MSYVQATKAGEIQVGTALLLMPDYSSGIALEWDIARIYTRMESKRLTGFDCQSEVL